MKTASQTKTKH